MLHKLAIHFVIVFLFAVTQIGATTHEISHLSHASQQTQPDQHTSPDQCSQCLAYAQSASGALLQTFVAPLIQAQNLFSVTFAYLSLSTLSNTYRARAPPVILS
jgi:hypothetical protein